jgi:inorganic triphosphatase YgiF
MAGSGVEIELKFQVPADAREALQRAVATPGTQVTRLQAIYADTADRRLAAAGLALRLRKEGRVWVQTLKGRGDGLMQRLEHEVRLAPQRGEPVLDPARHAGTPAGDALQAVLADGAALQPLYRTDIQRTHRVLRLGGARVEVALDEGRILAGSRTLPVFEIEFELLSGPPRALLAVAERWARRHRLWLDVRTKAERGHRLAAGLDGVPATRAAPCVFPAEATPAQAFAAMVQNTLAQALPNAAEVAAGHGRAEHLHQLRVALRRLRTALRLFGAWSADPAAASALELRLGELFTRLGAARDADALAATWLPALAAAGAPTLRLAQRGDAEDPGVVVRDPGFGVTLMTAMALALQPVAGPTLALAAAGRPVLRKAWRQAMADADAFADATPEVQHRTRKRLKRLRYALEFLQPLWPQRESRKLGAALRRALDALGAWNDLHVAEAGFAAQNDADPHVWWALGWLAAQRPRLLRRSARRLQRLAKVPRPWRAARA